MRKKSIHYKILSLLTLVIIGSCTLTGCSSLENTFVKDPVDVSKLKEMTPAEYEMRMNSYLVPIISNAESILTSKWQLETNGMNSNRVYELSKKGVEHIDQTILNIRQITPPQTHVQHKEDSLKILNEYQSLLIQYRDLAKKGNVKELDKQAKKIEAQLSLIKDLNVSNQGYKF